MSQAEQAELFAASEAHEPWKVWRAKGGFEIPYQEMPSGVLRVKFANGEVGLVTRQSVGTPGATPRLYLNHPLTGQLQQRGKRAFFKELACILRIREHAEKIVDETRELQKARSAGICHMPARPRRRNTLCTQPEPLDYEPRRIIPVKLIGELNAACDGPTFAPGFLWLEEREEPTSAEKRIYSRLATFAGHSGIARASVKTVARSSSLTERGAINAIQSLCNRHLIREAARGKWGIVHYEFLSHPWLDEWKAEHASTELCSVVPLNSVPPTAEQSSDKKREEKRYAKDESPSIERNSRPRQSSRTAPKTRALSRGEDSERCAFTDLDAALGKLAEFVGLKEISFDPPHGNRGLWITYFREDAVAFNEALGEFKLKRDSGTVPKKNAAAMITDDFKRIRDERKQARG